jgi:hypothetical protein
MVVRNDLDRYRLVMDVIDRVPGLAVRAAALRQQMADVRYRHHDWIRAHGADLPEVAEWTLESVTTESVITRTAELRVGDAAAEDTEAVLAALASSPDGLSGG